MWLSRPAVIDPVGSKWPADAGVGGIVGVGVGSKDAVGLADVVASGVGSGALELGDSIGVALVWAAGRLVAGLPQPITATTTKADAAAVMPVRRR